MTRSSSLLLLTLAVALMGSAGLAFAQSLSGPVCVAKAKVPGCNACDPPVTPATTTSKSKQVFTCTACGNAQNAYSPVFDTTAKRCPCNPNFAQNIDVSALLAAAQDTATYTKDQRKAFAKQAGLFKLRFVGGLGGVCMACPATPDLLGQTYTAVGGLTSVCTPVVVPPAP